MTQVARYQASGKEVGAVVVTAAIVLMLIVLWIFFVPGTDYRISGVVAVTSP